MIDLIKQPRSSPQVNGQQVLIRSTDRTTVKQVSRSSSYKGVNSPETWSSNGSGARTFGLTHRSARGSCILKRTILMRIKGFFCEIFRLFSFFFIFFSVSRERLWPLSKTPMTGVSVRRRAPEEFSIENESF